MSTTEYWTDMASEEAAERRKTKEAEGYWAIFDSAGNRASGKFQNGPEAKQSFTKTKGGGIFTWEEIEAKGFKMRYVNIKEVNEKMAQLENLLK